MANGDWYDYSYNDHSTHYDGRNYDPVSGTSSSSSSGSSSSSSSYWPTGFSSASGTAAVGTSGNDRIDKFGQSTSYKMWGAGGSDTLHGGSGADTYWFGKGEGNLTISGYESQDVVMLYNMKKSDLSNINMTYGSYGTKTLSMATSAGDKISFSFGLDNTKITFKFSDGSSAKYSTSSKSWV